MLFRWLPEAFGSVVAAVPLYTGRIIEASAAQRGAKGLNPDEEEASNKFIYRNPRHR